MVDTILKLLVDGGPFVATTAILLLTTIWAVRGRNRAEKLIDEMHEKRMEDFDRAIKLAERAKRLLNGHGETDDQN